ncbi:MAG: hypothetical protein HY423_11660 [Candidatus Lambdaproteobacteria bacterium]|nr:hypothetical protein [Candidatus Lambdaproteobacteria bacterium]
MIGQTGFIRAPRPRRRSGARWYAHGLVVVTALVASGASFPPQEQDVRAQPAEVRFMQQHIQRINPALIVEDEHCVRMLPWSIYRQAESRKLDWRMMFVLAWQESDFDCHAKSLLDRGGAYGPFQIRRLWEPIVGDPRSRYYDPTLAAERVAGVLEYYRATDRYQELVRRRFVYPLLCLYNTGESAEVNMRYCKDVSEKMRQITRSWARQRAPLRLAAR